MHFPTTFAVLLSLSSSGLAQATWPSDRKCPGVVQVTKEDEQHLGGVCCVGGELKLENCEGWPICKGPTSFDAAKQTPSCIVKVPMTASDFEERVSKATATAMPHQPGGVNSGTTTASAAIPTKSADGTRGAPIGTAATTTAATTSSTQLVSGASKQFTATLLSVAGTVVFALAALS
ncbi:hypothetical protein HRG_004686 [Hirsutella rhossiliensis]|uniref:Cell wall protein n=1 Tax=Hirsutella rhossiliensis TaxID=111463 RepID=A0A9P8MY85_9HYPO|nr:uncharacterized protein HRG_04686 [Hirsutella rhossiliensis]KAH0964258.1 hypothetical protein HRG_04686 [Hirsutella rhossiliensis]